MRLHLRDISEGMCAAWRIFFDGVPNVDITCGDIFGRGPHMDAEAIVSPANSFGFMDGGIDFVYSKFFGWEMSGELRRVIKEAHNGELLVGNAEVVKTGSSTLPWLISAPTMRVPMSVKDTAAAYLSFRAAIKKADEYGFESILCPGMGTAVGQMPFAQCARQMHKAWTEYVDGTQPNFDSLGDAVMEHRRLTNTRGVLR